MRHILLALTAAIAFFASAAPKFENNKPDLDKIKAETTDENSRFYYPKLLKMFMENDTVMTHEEYRYFYYGTLFQEDFDPYRPTYNEEEYREIEPLYYQQKHTRAERERMMDYARKAIANNPIDIIQLKNLVFVYEQNSKMNLAAIWKNKLNHILQAIASSGTGLDIENAWVVVYPRHEYDVLNLVGVSACGQEFVPPYYEKLIVNRRNDKEPEAYYFNIRPLLEQYYLKHPSELEE